MVQPDDTIQVIADSDQSATSDIHNFQPQAASTQQPQPGTFKSDQTSLVIAQRTKSPTVAYPTTEYEQLCKWVSE